MENYNHTQDDEELIEIICRFQLTYIAIISFLIGFVIGISV